MLSQKGLTLTAELKSAMEENVKDTVKQVLTEYLPEQCLLHHGARFCAIA